MNFSHKISPSRAYPLFIVLVALPLIFGDLQLVSLGGSFYYLRAAPVYNSKATTGSRVIRPEDEDPSRGYNQHRIERVTLNLQEDLPC